MRARGAQVTDIAVIVVAADDGVMPQTKEAIDHVRAARVPMIVAINKIDKPDANPDRVKQELSENGVLIEEYGGDIPSVGVSAKQKTGIDDLLEVIGLVADLQDLKANPNREAYGTIIESKVDKGRGNVATVLVQTGTLKVGDIVTVGKTSGRVRALQNAAGRRVKLAEPATAVEILGLQDLPEAGDLLRVVADEKAARDAAEAVERHAAELRRRQPGGHQRPDPGLGSQGAAGHPEDRRPGLAGRHPPRARRPEHDRDPDQHPQRGSRRHQRVRRPAGRRLTGGGRGLQHQARPRRRAGGRGLRRGRPPVRGHLQADR